MFGLPSPRAPSSSPEEFASRCLSLISRDVRCRPKTPCFKGVAVVPAADRVPLS